MGAKSPFVSVVVPAYNEAVMLPSCLESLKEQDYKGKYEIIVVDNNSSDLTPKIAKIYGARVISEKRQGVAFARQAGFLSAKGSLILTTDADSMASPNWISGMVKEFGKNKKIVAIGGYGELIGINTGLKLLMKLLLPIIFFVDKIISWPGTLIGQNFGVTKSAFLKVGGFNLTINSSDVGEDMELGLRLRSVGKVKKIFGIKVKTSARRYKKISKVIKYFILNYLYFRTKKKSLPGTFEVVRQKPYESYDSINDAPFFLMVILICIVAISFIIGAIPSFNLWSTSSVKTQDKILALTFENNINAENTKQIITTLEKNDVRATFFVTGEEAKKNPDIVKYIYNSGNVVGNGGPSTSVVFMFKNTKSIVNNVNSTNEIINKIINKQPKFFRPPKRSLQISVVS